MCFWSQNPSTAAATPSGLTVSTPNNRRWSVAAQSIASGHGGNISQALTPTAESIPAATMTKLVTSSTSVTSHGERKISFVIQDDSESATSSQTTLAIQVSLYFRSQPGIQSPIQILALSYRLKYVTFNQSA